MWPPVGLCLGSLGSLKQALGALSPLLNFLPPNRAGAQGKQSAGLWVQNTDLRRRSSESPCEVCKAGKEKEQSIHCQEGTALPSPGLKAQGAWLARCPWC